MRAQTKLEYGLQTGIRSVFSHKVMTLVSVVTSTACLVLISVLFLFSENINTNLEMFQLDNAMLAFVSDTLSESDARAIQPELERLEQIESVTFISKAEAFETYMAQYGNEDTDQYLEPTVFRDRYEIYLKPSADASDTAAEVENIIGIADTRVDEAISDGFAMIRQLAGIIGLFMAVLLLSIAIIIMTNTTKLTTLARKEEIAVMKMMGAYDSFVRLPFLVEGIFIGLFSTILAFAISGGAYIAITKLVDSAGILSLIVLTPYTDIITPLVILNAVLGLGVGIAGSSITIRKHLDV